MFYTHNVMKGCAIPIALTCLFDAPVKPEKYPSRVSDEKIREITRFTRDEEKKIVGVKKLITKAPSETEVRSILSEIPRAKLDIKTDWLKPISFAINIPDQPTFIKGLIKRIAAWVAFLVYTIPLMFIHTIDFTGITDMAFDKIRKDAVEKSRNARRYMIRPQRILRGKEPPPVLYLRAFSTDSEGDTDAGGDWRRHVHQIRAGLETNQGRNVNL